MACPYCDRAIELGLAEIEACRTRCDGCRQAFDILTKGRGEDVSVLVHATEPPPGKLFGDLSGRGHTRHVILSRRHWTRNLLHGVFPLALGAIIVAMAVWGIVIGSSIFVVAFVTALGLAFALAGVFSLWSRSEVCIRDRAFEITSVLGKWCRTRSFPASAVEGFSVEATDNGIFYISIELYLGRTMTLGAGHSADYLRWLASHLDQGVSLIRGTPYLPSKQPKPASSD